MNPHAAHLAVVAGNGVHTDNLFDLNRGEFHGTAFCIAPHLFITAAHVYEAAAATGPVALGRLGPPQPQIQLVRDAEVYRDVDVALLQCPNLGAEILPFNFAALTWLTDVVAFGYAFGLELADLLGQPHVYQLRAFKGHVINRRGLTQLPGVPPGYEGVIRTAARPVGCSPSFFSRRVASRNGDHFEASQRRVGWEAHGSGTCLR